MSPRLFWVELPELVGRLAITARPRGSHIAGDVRAWRDAGIDVVVSMLEPAEATAFGLDREGDVCREQGVSYLSVPIADHAVPASIESVETFVDLLADHLRSGRTLAFHCFAGLGRSPMIAAGVLVRAGLDAGSAIERLSRARLTAVPETPEQAAWIVDYARHLEARR